NPAAQWRPLNALGDAFLDHFVRGMGSAPGAQVYAFVTKCPARSHRTATPVSGRWDALADRSKVFTSRLAVTTSSAADNGADGAATDPLANEGCMTEPDIPPPAGVGEWDWRVPSGGMTLLGLPDIRVRYALTGSDATVAFK